MAARTYKATPANLARLAARLRAGEIVAVPTETVYGLAGDATSRAACRRIFAAKGRPADDPLIVHIASAGDLSRVAVPNRAATRLARKFWPGPLTLVLPKTQVVPDEATSGLPSVAVRVPAHPVFRRLIRLAGVPLAAPSANPFGYVSPTTSGHVRSSLGSRIRHILEGGPSSVGIESTIVDLRDPRRPAILRPGAITRAQIARALSTRVLAPRRTQAGVAPGQMKRHYSPRTPLVLEVHPSLAAARRAPGEAWLYLARPRAVRLPANVFWLGRTSDARRAARRLFSVLRRIDDGDFKRIHAERPRGPGLAEALRDRLGRAAAPVARRHARR